MSTFVRMEGVVGDSTFTHVRCIPVASYTSQHQHTPRVTLSRGFVRVVRVVRGGVVTVTGVSRVVRGIRVIRFRWGSGFRGRKSNVELDVLPIFLSLDV